LTRYLICINIIQYEEVGSRESKVTEGDPILFRNASGEPGGFISQMREERVSDVSGGRSMDPPIISLTKKGE